MTEAKDLNVILAGTTSQKQRWELFKTIATTPEEKEKILEAYLENATIIGEYQKVLHATNSKQLAERALECINERR